jgi:hypothetical protein
MLKLGSPIVWRRVSPIVLFALLVSHSFSQGENSNTFTLNDGGGRTVSGDIVTGDNTTGGGQMLLRVGITGGTGLPWTFPTTFWGIRTMQTHILVDGRFVLLPTARAAGTELTGTNISAHTPYTVGVVLAGISAQGDVSYRTGKYRTIVKINRSGVDVQTFDVEWQINAWGDVSGGGSSGGGGGGEGLNDPTAEGQQSFFESLFIPSEECLNDAAAAFQQVMDWGPLGLISDVFVVLSTESEHAMSRDAEFGVSFDGANTHTMAVDTSFWDGILGTVRAFMAFGIWVGFAFWLWRTGLKVMA